MKTKTVLFFTFLLSTTFTVTSQPALNWHANFNGGSNATDKVVSIAVDNNCNTIVTGQSDSIGQGIDIVTIKYDLNGNIVWQQRFDGADHLDDIPTDLKVDPNGNVYVCGRTQGTSTGFDFVTLKYTASGTLASGNWPAYYNNARWNGVNGFDGAESMAISPLNGNIYVAGESNNHLWTNSWLDLFMLRYDTLGNVVDSGVSGNGSLRDDYVKQVSFDNAGNVDLLMYDGIGFNSIYHYTPTLFNLSSSTFWNGLAVPPTNVSVDIASNKYYCFNTSTGFSEVKVSNTNSIFWNNAFRRTLSSVDDVKSIAVDNAGNSFVVASSTMSGASDIWLLKLTSNGDTVWTRTWGTGNGANDIPVKILQTSSPTRLVIVGNSTVGGVSTIVRSALAASFSTAPELTTRWRFMYSSWLRAEEMHAPPSSSPR